MVESRFSAPGGAIDESVTRADITSGRQDHETFGEQDAPTINRRLRHATLEQMRRGSVTARLSVAATAGVLVLAACGGGAGGDGESESGGESAGESADVPAAEAGEAAGASEAGEATEFAGVDLGSETLDPASDVPTNLFPDLVVDDVSRGKKVNLRNLIPSEKPVLVWMWAPF